MEGVLTCFSCRGPVEEDLVTVNGQNYHRHHFQCSVYGCPALLNSQGANYWQGNHVFCRYHYSTRFAPKCAGCTTAVLVLPYTGRENEYWHTECYVLATVSYTFAGHL